MALSAMASPPIVTVTPGTGAPPYVTTPSMVAPPVPGRTAVEVTWVCLRYTEQERITRSVAASPMIRLIASSFSCPDQKLQRDCPDPVEANYRS
jgi:hypothetical protein